MSEARKGGYTRVLAIVALIGSALYVSLIVIPSLPGFVRHNLRDFTQNVPFAYAAAILLLSLWGLARHGSWGPVKQHVVRGVLEGALLAYTYIGAAFLAQPKQWGDGTFQWATLSVGLLMTGPMLSSLGAASHLLYLAVGRIWRSSKASD